MTDDLLRGLDLHLVVEPVEIGPRADQLQHALPHAVGIVTEDERAAGEDVVQVLVAVHVPHAASLAVAHEERVGDARRPGVLAAPGQHLARLLEEARGTGGPRHELLPDAIALLRLQAARGTRGEGAGAFDDLLEFQR